MSDDLREQIARALWESRRSRLAKTDMHSARVDTDAVLAAIQSIVEQAERERDEWKAAEAEARMTIGDKAARHMLRADSAEARVATLEAACRALYTALERSAPADPGYGEIEYRMQVMTEARAALGDQDTTVTTTYGTENPVRKPKHLTYLGEQNTPAERCPTCGVSRPIDPGVPERRGTPPPCRDLWHAAPPVEEKI